MTIVPRILLFLIALSLLRKSASSPAPRPMERIPAGREDHFGIYEDRKYLQLGSLYDDRRHTSPLSPLRYSTGDQSGIYEHLTPLREGQISRHNTNYKIVQGTTHQSTAQNHTPWERSAYRPAPERRREHSVAMTQEFALPSTSHSQVDQFHDMTQRNKGPIAHSSGYSNSYETQGQTHAMPRIPFAQEEDGDMNTYREHVSTSSQNHSGDARIQGSSLDDRMEVQEVFPYHYSLTPSEYNLKISTHFKTLTNKLDERVWTTNGLTEEQKMVIMELVQQVSPYMYASIQEGLAANITTELARKLLSNDEKQIDSAVMELYPAQCHIRALGEHWPWMYNLNKWQRIEVIKRVSEATQQNPQHLRDIFLRAKMTSEVALKMLTWDFDEIRSKCAELKLYQYAEGDARRSKWRYTSSKLQRRALTQRMLAWSKMFYSDTLTANSCVRLLQTIRLNVPDSFGLRLLRADDLAFQMGMQWLMGSRGRPPPI
jgi:hypothetical protein